MDEKSLSIIILGVIILLFIVLGIILLLGRGSFLIAGYNTLSSEEKEKYDRKKLSKFVGKLILALSFSMFFWVFAILFEAEWLFILGLTLFFVITFAGVIYINTGKRFHKK